MKRVVSFVLIILTLTFIGCGSGNTSQPGDGTIKEHIKAGITQFLKDVENTAHLSYPLHQQLEKSSTYTLTVNRSGSHTYFYLTFHASENTPAIESNTTNIKVTVNGNNISVEGFYDSTLEDVANTIFSSSDTQWIKDLVYTHVSIIQVGNSLPYGAQYFLLFSSESPWDTYVSLKDMGIASQEPTKQEDGTYILKLKDGTVYLKEVDGGTDIYK